MFSDLQTGSGETCLEWPMAHCCKVQAGTSQELESNITDPKLHEKEYPFSEDKVLTEFMEISNLQALHLYRIDIHACNYEIHRCSAAAFVVL